MCEDNPRDVTRPRCNWGKVLVLFKRIVIAILIVFLLVLSSVTMIVINCN